jgi:hypothetical protein
MTIFVSILAISFSLYLFEFIELLLIALAIMLKSLIPCILTLIGACESTHYRRFYSGGGIYGGYPGYYGGYGGIGGYRGFGFNPIFFSSNNDLNTNNFHSNEFDRNTNAAVFNENIHSNNADAIMLILIIIVSSSILKMLV